MAAHSIDGGANWASVAKLPTDQSYNFLEETHIYNPNYLPQMPDLCFNRLGNRLTVGHSNGKYSTSTNGIDWTTKQTNQPNEAWFYGAGSYGDYPSGYYLISIGGFGGNILDNSSYPIAPFYKSGVRVNDISYATTDGGYAVGSNGAIFSNMSDLGVYGLNAWCDEYEGMCIEYHWSISMPDPQNALGNVYIYRSFNDGPMRLLYSQLAKYSGTSGSTIAVGETYKGIYRTYITSDYYGSALSVRYTKTAGPESPFIAPTTLTVSDVAGDQGGSVANNWVSTQLVVVGKADNPDGPFWPIAQTAGNGTYTDNQAGLGHTFYYCAQGLENTSNVSRASAVVLASTGSSVDNIRPDKYVTNTNYTGTYDATSHILHLRWDPSDEPNLAGYWICPIIGDEKFKFDAPVYYHLSHSTPIDRTTFDYQVPDYAWQNYWTVQFAVTSMDYSGNIGNWSDYLAFNTKAFTNSNTAMATAYNNGRHLLYDDNGKLHLTYTSVDSVFYQNSNDDGYTWSGPGVSGYGLDAFGTNPSSVIGISGNDTTLVWKAETPLSGWVLKTAKRSDADSTKWTAPQTILEQEGGGYDKLYFASPPAMAMNAAGTHLVLEKVDRFYNFGPSYGWNWYLLYGFRPAGGTDFTWTTLDSTLDNSGEIDNPASPTIDIDAKGGIHVAWDYEGEIYWKMHDPYTNSWKAKTNLSNSPGTVSDEPSLAIFGDVHLVWQEGNDIYHKKGNWGYPIAEATDFIIRKFNWQGWENVSNNSTTASLNPVFDGNYIAWSEASATAPNQYNAMFSNYSDFVWTDPADYSKNPSQPSLYPQIAYRQNVDGNKMTTIWTEGTGPLYSLIVRDSAGQVTAQTAADLGGTEPSIYTIERDGYLTYSASKAASITVDYDSTALEYYLPTLDREQKQIMKINLYQENAKKENYQYQLYVDDVSLGTVTVPSGKAVLFEKQLPNSVTHDGEGVLKIEKKKGAIVTCDWYQLFAYDKDCDNTKHGGAQSDMSETKTIAYRYELMQNVPNPCSKQTAINYQLAKQGQISLKVYNTLGQVVKPWSTKPKTPVRTASNGTARTSRADRRRRGSISTA